MPTFFEIGGHRLGQFHAHRVARRRGDLGREAVAVSGGLEERAGLVGVVGNLAQVGVAAHDRRERAGRGPGEARDQVPDDRLAVDGQRHGLAHAQVVVGLLGHVEAELLGADPGQLVHGDVAPGFEPRDVGGRDARDDVDVAALEGENARCRLRNRPIDDLAGHALVAPVVVEALEHHLLVLLPAGDAVRAGARDGGRGAAERLAVLGGNRRADDRRRDVGDRRLEGAKRVLGHDPDGERIDDLDTVDHREERQPLVVRHRVEHPFEVEPNRFGVERGAVVEADAAAQVERPGHAVVFDAPALGQARADLHLVVEGDERLVHHHDHLVGLGVGGVVRIERGGVGGGGEDQLVAGRPAGGAAPAAGGGGEGRAARTITRQ